MLCYIYRVHSKEHTVKEKRKNDLKGPTTHLNKPNHGLMAVGAPGGRVSVQRHLLCRLGVLVNPEIFWGDHPPGFFLH